MKSSIVALSYIMLAAQAFGGAQVFESGERRVDLMELFSSEGCSSCPPADAALATLRSDPELWKKFVPVEFHVDYWNRLGWIDRFSHGIFTARQYAYSQEWKRNGVYTPGFVFNGREFRPNGPRPQGSGERVGKLRAERKAGTLRFTVTFEAGALAGRWTQPFTAYGALLGNGLESRVTSGENNGSTLKHEFVALALMSRPLRRLSGGTFQVELELPAEARRAAAKSYSVAFWVVGADSMTPIQVVGGDLE